MQEYQNLRSNQPWNPHLLSPALYEDNRDDWEFCLSCGATEKLRYVIGDPFCGDCLERSSTTTLDELYDDLGCGD